MSKILCDKPGAKIDKKVENPPDTRNVTATLSRAPESKEESTPNVIKSELTTKNLGCFIDEIASKLDGKGKTTIKIQI